MEGVGLAPITCRVGKSHVFYAGIIGLWYGAKCVMQLYGSWYILTFGLTGIFVLVKLSYIIIFYYYFSHTFFHVMYIPLLCLGCFKILIFSF